ncbi:MAG: hypothetical protein WCK67_03050 [bacterium]
MNTKFNYNVKQNVPTITFKSNKVEVQDNENIQTVNSKIVENLTHKQRRVYDIIQNSPVFDYANEAIKAPKKITNSDRKSLDNLFKSTDNTYNSQLNNKSKTPTFSEFFEKIGEEKSIKLIENVSQYVGQRTIPIGPNQKYDPLKHADLIKTASSLKAVVDRDNDVAILLLKRFNKDGHIDDYHYNIAKDWSEEGKFNNAKTLLARTFDTFKKNDETKEYFNNVIHDADKFLFRKEVIKTARKEVAKISEQINNVNKFDKSVLLKEVEEEDSKEISLGELLGRVAISEGEKLKAKNPDILSIDPDYVEPITSDKFSEETLPSKSLRKLYQSVKNVDIEKVLISNDVKLPAENNKPNVASFLKTLKPKDGVILLQSIKDEINNSELITSENLPDKLEEPLINGKGLTLADSYVQEYCSTSVDENASDYIMNSLTYDPSLRFDLISHGNTTIINNAASVKINEYLKNNLVK